MRQRGFSRDSGGLRTFFIYAAVVLLFIFVSLAIKGFLVFQKSKFDGVHHFTLALARDGKLEEIIAFNPSTASFYLMRIQEGSVPITSLGRSLGIASDATIETKGESVSLGADVGRTMLQATLQYHVIKTDLTIFDTARLALLSKGMPENNKIIREINLLDSGDIDKIIASYFTDEAVSSEDISIHIINATDTPGVGKRLERVLSNMGANVVRVTSSEKTEKKSKIQYFGEETYTLRKLRKTFGFPVSILDKAGIGNIVITIGKDDEAASKF